MTDPRVSLAVVIPAFNEERRLPRSLIRLRGYLASQPWDWEIRVVDDGSSDQTCKVVELASREDSRIVLQAEPHRGKGGAVKAGMLGTKKSYRFLADADLSMPIEHLERFLPPKLTNFDVAVGSRSVNGARRIGEPWRRKLMGRVFNRIVQQLAVRGIHDTQCGFKMFTAAAAERIFPLVTVDGWAFDVEVLHIAQHHKLRIVEQPIDWVFDADSRVSPLRSSVAMFKEILEIRKKSRQGRYDAPHLVPLPGPTSAAKAKSGQGTSTTRAG